MHGAVLDLRFEESGFRPRMRRPAQESMMQAIRSTRPGGHVGYVGIPHGVTFSGEDSS